MLSVYQKLPGLRDRPIWEKIGPDKKVLAVSRGKVEVMFESRMGSGSEFYQP